MRRISTLCATLLAAVLLLTTTLDSARAQTITKQDMCASLNSLASTLSSCSVSSDCTCLSCNANLPQIGTIPVSICIVDTCTTPVCFKISSGSLFSETLCSTTVISFSIQQTITLPFIGSRTISVPVSVTVEMIQRPPSKIQITLTGTVSPVTLEIASATLCIYCPPPPPTTPPPTTSPPTTPPPTTPPPTTLPPNTSSTPKPPTSPTAAKPPPQTSPIPTTPPAPTCGKEKQTQKALKKLADKVVKSVNPTGNCTVNESTFEVLCSFTYTKRSKKGNGETLNANMSLTFDPCCPKMAVILAIRESSANAVPVTLTECFNQTSSASVEDSQLGSSLNAKVVVTFNREKKTIKFTVKTASILWAKAKIKLFWMDKPCTCLPTATPPPTTLPPPSTTTTPSPPTVPPKGLKDMCASLESLTGAFNASDTVTGTCTTSETCLNVQCNLEVQTGTGPTLPVALSVTLQPCRSPFAIDVEAETNFLNQMYTLVDGTYSSSATVPVMIFIISGTVQIDVTQVECGISLSVSGDFGSFGTFSLLKNASIAMYCSST